MKFNKLFISSLLLATSLLTTTSTFGVHADGQEGYTPDVFRIKDHYVYKLDGMFTNGFDSFEAWIHLKANSTGGTILSNYRLTANDIEYSVDGLGRIKMMWSQTAFSHTFNNKTVMDNKWHHIAVVRDIENSKFILYIDGELSDEVVSKQRALKNVNQIKIGVCNRINNLRKIPFDGEIRQITLYEGTISQDRVKEDMTNNVITSNDGNAKLVGNYYLGEQWTNRLVKDSSSNGINAKLVTYEKYVGVDNSYGDFDYSFIVFPDVQTCNRYQHTKFENLIDWVVDNKEELKLEFAMAVGDLSDVGSNEGLYESCAAAMNKMNGIVPWSFVPGNHDYDKNWTVNRETVYFRKYFSYDVHSKLPGFGGVYEEGTMENSYYLYNIQGIKYCVINLECFPRIETLRWADRLCEQFYDHRIILQTHAYIQTIGGCYTSDGAAASATETTSNPQAVWEYVLRRHKNVFMAFSGHYGHDDIVYTPQVGDHGNKVHSALMDAQVSRYNGGGIGEDIIGIVRINETKKTATYQWYSPHHDAIFNIQNQFDVSFADPYNPTVGA